MANRDLKAVKRILPKNYETWYTPYAIRCISQNGITEKGDTWQTMVIDRLKNHFQDRFIAVDVKDRSYRDFTIRFKAAPKVICYCGSLRVALDAFKKAEYEAVIKGEVALLPCCMFVDIQREYGAESDYKQKADELHKRKIDICDEVFVLNVGGYIGESTQKEIEYAKAIGKPIFYLECKG